MIYVALPWERFLVPVVHKHGVGKIKNRVVLIGLHKCTSEKRNFWDLIWKNFIWYECVQSSNEHKIATKTSHLNYYTYVYTYALPHSDWTSHVLIMPQIFPLLQSKNEIRYWNKNVYYQFLDLHSVRYMDIRHADMHTIWGGGRLKKS